MLPEPMIPMSMVMSFRSADHAADSQSAAPLPRACSVAAEHLPDLAHNRRMPGSTAAPSTRPCLHFLCGKAGAGKSRVAAGIAASEQAFLISEDVWLARLFGDQMHTFDDYRRLSLRLRTVVGPLAVEILQGGRSVVLDFPANTKPVRA